MRISDKKSFNSTYHYCTNNQIFYRYDTDFQIEKMEKKKKQHNKNHRFEDKKFHKQSRKQKKIRKCTQYPKCPKFSSVHVFFYHGNNKVSKNGNFQHIIQNARIIAGKKGMIGNVQCSMFNFQVKI